MAKRKNKPANPIGSSLESAEFLLASIRDPHNPKHCGTCLHGALVVNAERSSSHPAKKNRSPDPREADVYTSLIKFLLLERTDKQVDRLLERLSTCTCQISDPIQSYHDRGRKQSAWTMTRGYLEDFASGDDKSKFTAERCVFIADLFHNLLGVIKKSGIVSVAKGSSQTWPKHTDDLLPFGPDNFMQSMMRWYRFIPDTAVFDLTGQVLRVCNTLLIPSLAQFRMSHVVVESTRKLVDATMIDILSTNDGVRVRAAERFNYIGTNFISFLTLVLDQKFDIRAELVRGCETKAMQLCSILQYLSSDPYMPPCGFQRPIFKMLPGHGQDLFRFFHMHRYPRPDMPVHPEVVRYDLIRFPPPPPPDQRQTVTLEQIRKMRLEMRCSAYKCTNSLQTSGNDFQRCARCMVVSYCGRECQTRAWKEEKYPHKRVCPSLRSLIDRGGGHFLFFKEEATMMVLQNWINAGVIDDDLNTYDDWNKMIYESRGYPVPDGTEWTPGYEDYNEIIAQLSAEGRGPKGTCVNILRLWWRINYLNSEIY